MDALGNPGFYSNPIEASLNHEGVWGSTSCALIAERSQNGCKFSAHGGRRQVLLARLGWAASSMCLRMCTIPVALQNAGRGNIRGVNR